MSRILSFFKDAIKGGKKLARFHFSYAPFYEIVLSLNLPSWEANQMVMVGPDLVPDSPYY